jgi:hypothetical protein
MKFRIYIELQRDFLRKFNEDYIFKVIWRLNYGYLQKQSSYW